MNKGKFIVLEGIDGAGKSTQALMLFDYLKSKKIKVDSYWCPGGSEQGYKIRKLIMDGGLNDEACLLMFMADMAQLQTEIKESLNAGRWVICDRYIPSFFAYHDHKFHDFVYTAIRKLEFAIPDLVLYLFLDVYTAYDRMESRGDLSIFEKKGIEYMRNVQEKYMKSPCPFASEEIDANYEQSQVFYQIKRKLEKHFANELKD